MAWVHADMVLQSHCCTGWRSCRRSCATLPRLLATPFPPATYFYSLWVWWVPRHLAWGLIAGLWGLPAMGVLFGPGTGWLASSESPWTSLAQVQPSFCDVAVKVSEMANTTMLRRTFYLGRVFKIRITKIEWHLCILFKSKNRKINKTKEN